MKVSHVLKYFDDVPVLNGISMTLEQGRIYGIVGSNGAGKSTLLRLMSGVYCPEEGHVTLDGQVISASPCVRERIAYVADELFFLQGGDLRQMERLYASVYPRFDHEWFIKRTEEAALPYRAPIRRFSKGMKRQAATLLALATQADYLLFDETFDGLDPVMRRHIKGLLGEAVLSHGATVVITSHSLRELEDTCDELVMLHRGRLVLSSELSSLCDRYIKVQVGFHDPYDIHRFDGIPMAQYVKHGSVSHMILTEDAEGSIERLRAMSPAVLDILPLSPEEVFAFELEVLGYRFDV